MSFIAFKFIVGAVSTSLILFIIFSPLTVNIDDIDTLLNVTNPETFKFENTFILSANISFASMSVKPCEDKLQLILIYFR